MFFLLIFLAHQSNDSNNKIHYDLNLNKLTKSVVSQKKVNSFDKMTLVADNIETIVFHHRNETRRLRMRISDLEFQNKVILIRYFF